MRKKWNLKRGLYSVIIDKEASKSTEFLQNVKSKSTLPLGEESNINSQEASI